MRNLFLSVTLAAAALLGSTQVARADFNDNPYVRLVDGWYHRYLGRHVDGQGLRDHVEAMRLGTPVEVVEAAILGSPEYAIRHGSTPEGFVMGLFTEVAGRYPNRFELDRWVQITLGLGNRQTVALRFLRESRDVPVVVAPQPTVVQPVVVQRPVIVDRAPWIVQPAPRVIHHPGPGFRPQPQVGINLRFGR